MRRRATITAAAAATAAVLTMVACGGGGGGDEEQIRDTVSAFVEAGNDGDAAAACGQLASERVEGIGKLGGGSCEEALGRILDQAGRPQTAVEIDDVRIDGSRATADVTITQNGDTRNDSVLLVKEDGDWRLASAGF